MEPHKQAEGYAVVRTVKGRERSGIRDLGPETTFVHIDGMPMLWAIQGILENAPNLKTIQVVPSAYGHLNPENHLRLCEGRGVSVVKGYHRPELAWAEGQKRRGPQYEKQRAMFLNLGEDARVLFEELVRLGFEEALIVSRYFCLGGEPPIVQRMLAQEYGFADRDTYGTRISVRLYAVMNYLDPRFEVNIESEGRSKAMRARVERTRAHIRDGADMEETQQVIAQLIGIDRLPQDMPLARYEILQALIEASRAQTLNGLAREHPRAHQAVVWRFGLELWDERSEITTYRTLANVGQIMGEITRERVRQLVEIALEQLGIASD